MALKTVQEETGAPAWINAADTYSGDGHDSLKLNTDGVDIGTYKDGDVFTVSGLTFDVIETPGHSPGSVTLRCSNALFSGDTLFRDSCGRTDLEGGNMETMLASLKKLSALEGNYEVYPGHGDSTNLDRERSFNYYVKYANEET